MDSLTFVIFGITSNLSQIYLIHALYDLASKNLLPANLKIIGISRTPQTDSEIKEFFSKVLHSENRHHMHEINPEVFSNLYQKFYHLNGQLEDPKFYSNLKNYIDELNPGIKNKNIIYYLATYPDLYKDIFENIKIQGLADEKNGWVRLLIEKPIGNDLSSAKALNKLLLSFFKETQIFRLDHYLGKETLQNILTFRFSNNIFEHLINADFVDHIQVSLLEDFGVGKRGQYYDSVGALKDVGQNHLLQMIALATMDKPIEFNHSEIAKQRTKILKNLVPLKDKIVFGQYRGYTSEENINPNSSSDTFFAFKTEIDNERFKGVPIYVRSGKKLTQTVAEISIVFKKPVDTPFTDIKTNITPNVLIYRIQPNEGIVLKINTKRSGHTQELEETYMQFCYRDYGPLLTDAHEKLMADALKGDQTFFNNAAEVETQWAFIDPLVKAQKKPVIYEPGTYGPKEADELIEADGRKWLEPSMMFCKI